MNTFIILDWAGTCTSKLEELGYQHQERVAGDWAKHVRKLFNAGLNVMLYHGDKDIIVFVDTRRFWQR